MALQNSVFMLIAVASLMANAATSAREIPVVTNPGLADLATRLKVNYNDSNATGDCWTALSELRSCSNEIVAFFLNGYTDIDTPRCNAIEVITRHYWPSMLSVLGFTAQQGTLLAGYCHNTSSAPAAANCLVILKQNCYNYND